MSIVSPQGEKVHLPRGSSALTRVELIYAAGDPDRLMTLQWLHLRESGWTFGQLAKPARVHRSTVIRRLRRVRSDLRQIFLNEEGKCCVAEDSL